jgi:adenylate kinase
MEHATESNTILLMGRPGSGKGTQAKLLSEELNWIRLSSGDRIKEIRDGGEPFSPRVREMYDKGTLLPNWFADYLLESSLLEIESYVGIVLEGFGRTESQARHLLEIVSWLERNLIVFNLEVSEEEVMKRMIKRSETEDRPDSNGEDKVRARLAQYDEQTAPALAYFREHGMVIDIKGEQSPEQIARDIAEILDPS